MSSPITRTRTKPCLPLQVAAEQNVPLPNRSYVYVIHVDGVLHEAVMKGAVIEEIVLADNLTAKQAYKL